VFVPAHAHNDVVEFEYEHEGRQLAHVFVHIVTMQIKYESHGGLTHDWHGLAAERGMCGSYVSKPHHKIQLGDFSSHFGIPTRLRFEQRGVRTWMAVHPRVLQPIYLVLKLRPRFQLALPTALTPSVLPLPDADDFELVEA